MRLGRGSGWFRGGGGRAIANCLLPLHVVCKLAESLGAIRGVFFLNCYLDILSLPCGDLPGSGRAAVFLSKTYCGVSGVSALARPDAKVVCVVTVLIQR